MKDLFGNKIKVLKTIEEEELLNFDRESLKGRVERLKYINGKFSFGTQTYGSDESFRVFNETLHSFIFGQFVSTIILSVCFIERRFQEIYHIRGDLKRSKYTLSQLLIEFRNEGQLPEFLISKIDAIRLKRNPIIHHRDINNEHTFFSRSQAHDFNYEKMLYKDACDAIDLVLTINRIKIL